MEHKQDKISYVLKKVSVRLVILLIYSLILLPPDKRKQLPVNVVRRLWLFILVKYNNDIETRRDWKLLSCNCYLSHDVVTCDADLHRETNDKTLLLL